MKTNILWILALFALFGCSGCSDDGPQSTPGFEDYAADPAIFASRPEAAKVQTFVEDGDADLEFRAPVDELLLLLDTGATRAEAEALAAELDGELVGFVPEVTLAQLRFDAVADFEALEAKRLEAEAASGVEVAAFNLMPAFDKPGEEEAMERSSEAVPDTMSQDERLAPCQAETDLGWLSGPSRPSLEEVGYFQFVPIVDKLRQMGQDFAQVTVCVVDSGLDASCPHFDDVPLLNVIDPGEALEDDYEVTKQHGTKVSSVIAADDGDGGPNGIASRVLPGKLRLAVVADPYDLFAAGELLAYTAQAIQGAKARVVNMSFGYGKKGKVSERLLRIRRIYRAFILQHPSVLFVVAADNFAYELTSAPDDPAAGGLVPASEKPNDCPAGIKADNVITVGGTAFDDPGMEASFSSFGPRIDLAAPAEKVPVIFQFKPDRIAAGYGNSFGTPLVAAAAAVLLSFDPELTPGEIKELLILNAAPTTDVVNGRRLRLAEPLMQHLVDSSASLEALDFIDADEDGVADPPAFVAMRICGGMEYSVEGYADEEILGDGAWSGVEETEEEEGFAAGALMESGWSLTATAGGSTFVLSCTECGFAPLSESVFSAPGEVAVMFSQEDTGYAAMGVSGTLMIEGCEVMSRDNLTGPGLPDDNAPSVVAVEGLFGGQVEFAHDSTEVVRARAKFRVPFIVPLGVDGDLIQRIEENCIGGIENPNTP